MALEQQRIELTGSVDEQLALIARQAREVRVEHCRQQAMRRLKNLGLTFAWTTWQELCVAKARQLQLLHASSNRLQRPQLTAAFSHWTESWDAEQKTRIHMALAAQGDAGRRRCAELEKEVERLGTEHAAALSAVDEAKRAPCGRPTASKRVALLTMHVGVAKTLAKGARLPDLPRRCCLCGTPL